jgi:hypothetical protein
MKKLSVVIIMLVGSIAFASSLAIPWYVDNAPAGPALPPTIDGAVSVIYLKSTVTHVVTCEIAYYNDGGAFLGPQPPNNTFTIAPLAALGFRPVATDGNLAIPGGLAGGLEGPAGYLVPNRPRSADSNTVIPGTTIVDLKKNGSITVSWTGDPTDVQGTQQAWAKGGTTVVSFSHLLPPGK